MGHNPASAKEQKEIDDWMEENRALDAFRNHDTPIPSKLHKRIKNRIENDPWMKRLTYWVSVGRERDKDDELSDCAAACILIGFVFFAVTWILLVINFFSE